MTFDSTVSLWCLLVPAVISLVALAVGAWTASRRSLPDADVTSPLPSTVVAGGWWLATMIAVTGRLGWEWWPEDAWRRPVWATVAFALVLAVTSGAAMRARGGRWVAAGVIAVLLAWSTMPTGDGWEDVLPLHRSWMAAVMASCLVNAWAVDRLVFSGGSRFALWVVLAGLGGPMLLAAATYGTLAEWGLAAIAATLVMAIAASLNFTSAVASAYPAVATAASLTASARFYSYEDHPGWMYGVVLFLPALVTTIDVAVQRRSLWLRVVVAGCVAAALLGLVAWTLFLNQPEEPW